MEILPDSIASEAVSFCTCLFWLSQFVIGLVFPLLLQWLHITWVYLMFAAGNFIAFFFFEAGKYVKPAAPSSNMQG